MTAQEIIAILIMVTTVASYLNYRYIKLPSSIGLTLIMLVFSLFFIGLDFFGLETHDYAQEILGAIDFNETFMGGMLSLLLFAGALHVNTVALAKHRLIIGILSTLGVLLSAFLVATFVWSIAFLLNIQIKFVYCLLFGTLIAPTDPVAVLGILRKVKTPRSWEMPLIGESLFNDGIGLILFFTTFKMALGGGDFFQSTILWKFLQQLFGGVFLGAALGYGTRWLLNQVDNFELSVLITLSLTTAGYLFATMLGTSGPIAMVSAGLVVGYGLKAGVHSKKVTEGVLNFWKLVDGILNAILFVLIGLVIFQLAFTLKSMALGLLAIPAVLIARFFSVSIPLAALSKKHELDKNKAFIFTWGGLRGGISIALALSLPLELARDKILVATYCVVVFSLLVQGLTIARFIKKAIAK